MAYRLFIINVNFAWALLNFSIFVFLLHSIFRYHENDTFSVDLIAVYLGVKLFLFYTHKWWRNNFALSNYVYMEFKGLDREQDIQGNTVDVRLDVCIER